MRGIRLRTAVRRWLVPWSSIFFLRQWRALRRYRDLLDGKASHGVGATGLNLTASQREAVVANEPTTIVVASAGSGKTAVVVAKVAYLLASRQAAPEGILLLAFNREAANEMRQRCAARLGHSIRATTFHALGRDILKSRTEKTLRLSELAEDPRKFAGFLRQAIVDLEEDPKFRISINRLVRIDRSPELDKRKLSSLEEYEAYTRTELRALDGTLLKSRGELEIANLLYVRGVRFSYERPIGDVVVGAPRDYRPDFHLPDHGVWIEFFGVDREGRTAPNIDRVKYLAEMAWKKALHSRLGTKLISLYSWQHVEGSLIGALESALGECGVEEKPRSSRDLLRELNALDWPSAFSTLVGTFLTHFRSNGLTTAEVRSRAAQIGGLRGDRARAFLDAFELIAGRYGDKLASERAIDFADMIAAATGVLRSRKYHPPWTHVIVDEFQDISIGRYRLLAELLKARPKTSLFAVGDDWQSINRFAGADASIMTRADRYFAAPAVVFLGETFRFGQRLARVSSEFIARNPRQIRKQVTGRGPDPEISVALWWTAWERSAAVVEVARRLAEADEEAKDRSLLVLARYRDFLPNHALRRTLEEVWPGDLRAPNTAHGSKGLEADYVILLDVRNALPKVRGGRLTIPASMTDDPILTLVMPEEDAFEHAEERRLLYVALTRAKRRVDLVCHRAAKSPFATELAEHRDVRSFGRPSGKLECPVCKSAGRGGRLVRRGSGGAECSNPECDVLLPMCPVCEALVLAPYTAGRALRCSDGLCAGEGEMGVKLRASEAPAAARGQMAARS
jgi:DNA helicase-4